MKINTEEQSVCSSHVHKEEKGTHSAGLWRKRASTAPNRLRYNETISILLYVEEQSAFCKDYKRNGRRIRGVNVLAKTSGLILGLTWE